MKNFANIRFFLGLLSLLSLDSFANSKVIRGTTPSGIVSDLIEGLVEIKNKDGVVVASTNDNVQPNAKIKKGFPFYEGETFVTGSDGKIRLQFAEGKNEVFLGPNTTLVIQRAPFDLRIKRGTRLFLDAGSAESKVHQKYSGIDGEQFRIETKSLVAGVRGTVFMVEHNPSNNVSSVMVSSGIVEVLSASDNKVRAVLKDNEKIDSTKWKKLEFKSSQKVEKSSQKPSSPNNRN